MFRRSCTGGDAPVRPPSRRLNERDWTATASRMLGHGRSSEDPHRETREFRARKSPISQYLSNRKEKVDRPRSLCTTVGKWARRRRTVRRTWTVVDAPGSIAKPSNDDKKAGT